MRILYGVQATGNGHITRARVMLPALKAQGFEVDFLFSGRSLDAYFDMDIFGHYQIRKGFTFAGSHCSINWLKTIQQAEILNFYHDVQSLALTKYDLVITDFEPVSAWAAKIKKIPSVGLAHQYALAFGLPGLKFTPGIGHILHTFAPAKYPIGVHWDHFGQTIIPPLIHLNHETPTREDDVILVYLPFEAEKGLFQWLGQVPNQRFVVYSKSIVTEQISPNIVVKPLSRETFPVDFANCQGVISNTGFGLCSEAMVLGKKILTFPIKGQIEQRSNAEVLKQLNRATVIDDYDVNILQQWLKQPSVPKAQLPDVATEVAKWLAKGELDQRKNLVDSLWEQTKDIQLSR
ncbi:MJ1255/VC2487 family glycosyltransferase [Pelistega sp. MC2]|uniref:MJ1255/VC2487 family glycosyltransferase n=1 Tax=Pelistega sp. MC2 TaxID=1720297 RepID=UPI0008DA6D24|nr:MJ1255/VC2487 family glycosyltransferase [Pelistega sp. MC2]